MSTGLFGSSFSPVAGDRASSHLSLSPPPRSASSRISTEELHIAEVPTQSVCQPGTVPLASCAGDVLDFEQLPAEIRFSARLYSFTHFYYTLLQHHITLLFPLLLTCLSEVLDVASVIQNSQFFSALISLFTT